MALNTIYTSSIFLFFSSKLTSKHKQVPMALLSKCIPNLSLHFVFSVPTLMEATIISFGDYCNDFLTGLPAAILALVKNIFFIARSILKTQTKPTNHKLDYITPLPHTHLLKSHQWLLITFIIKFKVLIFTYKTLYDLASACFADLISYHFPFCLSSFSYNSHFFPP